MNGRIDSFSMDEWNLDRTILGEERKATETKNSMTRKTIATSVAWKVGNVADKDYSKPK